MSSSKKNRPATFVDDPGFYLEFGNRVATARGRLRLTQAELAARLGIARNSVARIEMGKQRCLAHAVRHIAKALGISHEDLMRDGSSSPDELMDPTDRAVLLDEVAQRSTASSKLAKKA